MENRFYYIDENKANELIEKASLIEKPSKRGGNSRAFIIDDYAVLKASGITLVKTAMLPEDQVYFDVVIDKLQDLKKKGVNVVPILGYSYDSEKISTYDSSARGGYKECYAPGYVIQPKAKGAEMWDREHMRDKDYVLNRTKTFANAPQKHFDKFVADYKAILEAGIKIDPSKKANFFYDKEIGFSFIDLNFFYNENGLEKNKKYLPTYCCLPVHNNFYMSFIEGMTKEEFNELSKNNILVFEKCKKAMIKNGIISEKDIMQSLKDAIEDKNDEDSKYPPIYVAGLTNDLELEELVEMIIKHI